MKTKININFKIIIMNLTELKNDLDIICSLFDLGTLKGYETQKNYPIPGYDTAFFTVHETKETYKYNFLNNRYNAKDTN